MSVVFETDGSSHRVRDYKWNLTAVKDNERGGSGKRAVIVFERHLSQFFINVYIPTAAMVLVSFISFIVPVETVPGRMTLLVTIFLMLVNMGNSQRGVSPKVNKKPS